MRQLVFYCSRIYFYFIPLMLLISFTGVDDVIYEKTPLDSFKFKIEFCNATKSYSVCC